MKLPILGKRCLANAGLLAVSLLFSIAALELSVRLLYPQHGRVFSNQRRTAVPLFRAGEHRPIELIPGLALRNQHDAFGEFSYDVDTDAHGFRRTDPLGSKPLIFVFGDSQTFGVGVSNREAYPDLLDERLPDCDVVNAGVPATDLSYYHAYLAESLRRFRGAELRQVVVGLTVPGNDYYGFPKNAALDLSHYRYVVQDGYLVAEDSSALSLRGQIDRRLTKLHAYSLAKRTVKAVVARADRRWHPHGGHARTKYVLDMIGRIHRLGAEANVPVLFLFLPESRYMSQEVAYLSEIQDSLRAQSIPYVDLTAAMRRRSSAVKDFYFPIDQHFNAQGHELVAEEILESGLLECE